MKFLSETKKLPRLGNWDSEPWKKNEENDMTLDLTFDEEHAVKYAVFCAKKRMKERLLKVDHGDLKEMFERQVFALEEVFRRLDK